MPFSLRRTPRGGVLTLVLVIALLLTLVGMWNYTSVGCVPTPLPHWTPPWLQSTLEARCNA